MSRALEVVTWDIVGVLVNDMNTRGMFGFVACYYDALTTEDSEQSCAFGALS